MPNENSIRRYSRVLAFAVFLLFPSFDTIRKYGGVNRIVAYFVIGTCLLILAERYVLPIFETKLSARNANILAAVTLLGLIATVAVVYPIANKAVRGVGSDADDALITAARELLSGDYPYEQQTYLGNPISPMPGAILLAIPFVLTGLFPFQNIFWFAALFFAGRQFGGGSSRSLAMIWAILLFSPTVMWNFATGSDYATNTIYVALLIWLLVKKVSDSQAPEWQPIVTAILLGVGLSSRSNFLLLMPLVLSILVQNAGWRSAIKYLSISGVAFLLVTVPFWLYNPEGFTPLTTQGGTLKNLTDVLPFADILVPGSAIVLSIVLAVRRYPADCGRFFRNCAVVQLFVLLFVCILSSIKLGRPDIYLNQAGYGMFTLIFGVIGWWIVRFSPSLDLDK